VIARTPKDPAAHRPRPGIQPLDASTRGGVSPEALADPRRIADAVLFLANQDARSATHELQLTPLAESWTP
jgi:hypothetical protein